MKENSLTAAVDNLAKRKAQEFLTHVKVVVQNALKDAWRAKVAGGDAFLGDDIKAVLRAYTESIGIPDAYRAPEPSDDLVNNCRATIINDLIGGLPKLKELAIMLEDSHES